MERRLFASMNPGPPSRQYENGLFLAPKKKNVQRALMSSSLRFLGENERWDAGSVQARIQVRFGEIQKVYASSFFLPRLVFCLREETVKK